jgi:outer membrane protein
MKREFFLIFFFFLVSNFVFGQKFGYVDTQYVLSQMEEYEEAKQEIEKVSLAWQDEIKDKQKEIEAMYSALKAEEVLLTEAMKEQRMEEIRKSENALKEYNKKVFGFEGMFFLKQKEILQPVQEKVFDAVETVAVKQKLQIVFDKSGDLVMIYTNPVHDYTDYVLEELGLGDKNDTIE